MHTPSQKGRTQKNRSWDRADEGVALCIGSAMLTIVRVSSRPPPSQRQRRHQRCRYGCRCRHPSLVSNYGRRIHTNGDTKDNGQRPYLYQENLPAYPWLPPESARCRSQVILCVGPFRYNRVSCMSLPLRGWMIVTVILVLGGSWWAEMY